MRRPLLSRSKGTKHSGIAAFAPMVDLLTILLVFLLKSYSTDPPVRPDDPTFDLPRSTAIAEVNHVLALDLTDHGVYLGGARVAGTRYYLEQDQALITELYNAMLQSPGTRVQIRADEDLPYVMVRKALFTLQQAGIQDVTVVAVSRSSL